MISDVIEDLQNALVRLAGSSSSMCEVDGDILTKAIDEIRMLRSKIEQLGLIAGKACVDRTLSFEQIKKDLRNGGA